MLEAVAATYDGMNFVMDRHVQFEKGQQVIITFSKPVASAMAQDQATKKAEAWKRLERMRKHVPDFDYKKELEEYRQERYYYNDRYKTPAKLL